MRNKSTTDAILKFTELCYSNFNNKNVTIGTFLDLSKAFDTLNHDLLCRKLCRYGIRGNMNKWFQSYLSYRSQYVSIGNSDSSVLNVNCGVPQGSILGPLLFLIYINDMHKCTSLDLIHFADDTTAISQGPTIEDAVATVARELEKVDRWLCSNKLSLNINKSSFLIFTNKKLSNIPIISIRSVPIKYVDCFKFLGIMVDNKLSYSNHVNNVCSKVNRCNGIFKKLSSHIPLYILTKIRWFKLFRKFL